MVKNWRLDYYIRNRKLLPLNFFSFRWKAIIENAKNRKQVPFKVWCSWKITIRIDKPLIEVVVHQNILSGSARLQALVRFLYHETVFTFLIDFGVISRLKIILFYFFFTCLDCIVFDYFE